MNLCSYVRKNALLACAFAPLFTPLNPPLALLAYLALRGIEPGPLFKMSDGRFLTKQIESNFVRSRLRLLLVYMQATASG